MRSAPIAVIGLVTVLLAGACGSDSSDGQGGGASTSRPATSTAPPGRGPTRLTVEGEATRVTADPVAEPPRVAFSGTLDCADAGATGTGIYSATAVDTCAGVIEHRETFAALAEDDSARICTEIYGGPQHARIDGTVAGARVQLKVTRSDGCGISDWTQLEFLLGPPER